jgi:hypothetical protein
VKLFNQILDDPNHKLNELVSRPNSPLIHDLHKEKAFLLRSFLQTVLKTLLSLLVVLAVVKIRPSTFTLTLDFLPSPSTFYPHPRLFTLTLDIGPSTLDLPPSTLDKNLNSSWLGTITVYKFTLDNFHLQDLSTKIIISIILLYQIAKYIVAFISLAY